MLYRAKTPVTKLSSPTVTAADGSGKPSPALDTAIKNALNASSSAETISPKAATIRYDGTTFAPANVTVMQGATVTITDTVGTMWVASDPHPTHTGYDGTPLSEHCKLGYLGAAPFDQCSVGSTYTFVFNKVGAWSYHDHKNYEAHGIVTVVAK